MSDVVVVTKYIYLSFYFAEHKSTINAKSSCRSELVRLQCKNRSFPTHIELWKHCVTLLQRGNVNTNFITELVVLSFDELSREKAACLYPDIDLDGEKVSQLII